MRVLVACEFSGVVSAAFRARGHEAWSCDLLPVESLDPTANRCHLQADASTVLYLPHRVAPWVPVTWDLVIAHPPCTYLANSGVRRLYQGGRGSARNKDRWARMEDAADFFRRFWNYPCATRIAVENPVMHKYARALIGDGPSQVIQPWQFGHGEIKGTGLWLRNLPPLVPTNVVEGRSPRVHHESPGPDRWKRRSRTLQGIADAMAEQWGCL